MALAAAKAADAAAGTVEQIDRDSTRLKKQREVRAHELDAAKTAVDTLRADRDVLLEARIDGDESAERQLADNARRLFEAECTLADAKQTLALIDAKLAGLNRERAATQRAADEADLRRLEAADERETAALVRELQATANRMARWKELKLQVYSKRNDLGISPGRTPSAQAAEVVRRVFGMDVAPDIGRPLVR